MQLRLLVPLHLLLVATSLLPAQGKGGGGAPTTLLQPVIIGRGNISSTSHGWQDDQHQTMACGQMMWHPAQLSVDGSQKGLIHSISGSGDLSHEGGARWVLDVRVTVAGGVPLFNALIATPQTIATSQNPTWHYLPAQDDPIDRVLLDASSPYRPYQAQWSTQVVAGKIKVGFFGSGPVVGVPKTGLFVGAVTWGAAGPLGPLQDVTLIAEGDFSACWPIWKWGTASVIAFLAPTPAGDPPVMLADVSAIPSPPTIVWSGVNSRHAALSRDGRFLAYLALSGTKELIHIRDLVTTATVALPWPSGGGSGGTRIDGIEWSPDNLFVCFVFRDFNNGHHVYKQATTSNYKTTRLYSDSTTLGSLRGEMLWRR